MGLILDTCIFIHAEKHGINFDKWQKYGGAYMSSITMSEILVGVHRADTAERRIKRSTFMEAMINSIAVLPFDEECARIHAQIRAYLQAKGAITGAHDLIIAATALCHNHAVLTFNEKEFRRVPGLEVVKGPSKH